MVKNIAFSDIDRLVAIHQAAFPNFFLTQLGDRFLRVYYSAFYKQNGILLGYYTKENQLLGFCAAIELSKGFK